MKSGPILVSVLKTDIQISGILTKKISVFLEIYFSTKQLSIVKMMKYYLFQIEKNSHHR